MTYELWDIETANLVGAYATGAEALVMVQRALDAYGAGYADGLALVLDDDQDDVRTLAIGADLASRAESARATAALVVSST